MTDKEKKLKMYKVHGEPKESVKEVEGKEVKYMASNFDLVQAENKKEALVKSKCQPAVRAFEILDKMRVQELRNVLEKKAKLEKEKLEKSKPAVKKESK